MPSKNNPTEPWEDVIGNYNRQTAESRISVVFPDILLRLSAQKPLRVLDYGCGPGFFLRDFSSLLGVPQTGYDIAPAMIADARRNCADTAATSIVTNLADIPDSTFDAITSIAVWMCWDSEAACAENLATIRRLVAQQGRFYAVVTHPAFRDRAFSTFSLHLDQQRYLEDGAAFAVHMGNDTADAIAFTDYHWSLSAMVRQLRTAGFLVDDIVEYADTSPCAGSPWLLIVARPA